MKILDRGLSGLGADASSALARKKPDAKADAGAEPRTVVEGGAYSLSLSGRATELARSAPAPVAARVDDLRKSYADPSWQIDAPAVAAKMIEEG
jgi:hypothetical protein